MADEVYQSNIYQPETRPFHSFKKVVCRCATVRLGNERAALLCRRSMGPEYQIELFSFHSVSKGMIGECGRRGGYVECHNIDGAVLEQLYKLSSISLCPTVQGQMTVDLMVNPPKPGDASYASYKAEVDGIYGTRLHFKRALSAAQADAPATAASLVRRAKLLAGALNKMEGVSCNEPEGAMYVFPRIRLPEGAIKAAAAANQKPDVFYSLAMLDATGVVRTGGKACVLSWWGSFDALSSPRVLGAGP